MPQSVLIISYEDDSHLSSVISHLSNWGIRFWRIDRGDYPAYKVSVESGHGKEEVYSISGITLDENVSIWWRRPSPITSLVDYRAAPNDVREYSRNSCRTQFEWFCDSAPGFWVNRPRLNSVAENKLYQMQLASEIGLKVPKTIYSNDHEEVLHFCKRTPSAIIKITTGKDLVLSNGMELPNILTHRLHTSSIQDETVRKFPVFVQEEICKEYEIRATIVGNEVFAVGIDSQAEDSASIDCRRDYERLHYFDINLPLEVRGRLLELHSKLGLRYSASDLAVSSEGDYVFFEVNPNGQYQWIDDLFNGVISRAMAELLSQDH